MNLHANAYMLFFDVFFSILFVCFRRFVDFELPTQLWNVEANTHTKAALEFFSSPVTFNAESFISITHMHKLVGIFYEREREPNFSRHKTEKNISINICVRSLCLSVPPPFLFYVICFCDFDQCLNPMIFEYICLAVYMMLFRFAFIHVFLFLNQIRKLSFCQTYTQTHAHKRAHLWKLVITS